MLTLNTLPIAVIGAGPVGLAAAAHLAQRQLPFMLFESGDKPAATMAEWRHVTIFSPWRYNVDCAARELLEATGWRLAEEDLDRDPAAGELIDRYLAPLAALPQIAPFISYGTKVTAVTRDGLDLVPDTGRADRPFELRLTDRNGGDRRVLAAAVIDASGTWGQPNPAGATGIPADGERRLAARITTGIPDVRGAARNRFAGRRILVIGSGHSAMDVLLDLAELRHEVPDTTILWAMRSMPTTKTFGGGDDDQLASRGALGTRTKGLVDRGDVGIVAPFRTRRFEEAGGRVRVSGADGRDVTSVEVDEVIVATGFRPDFSMYSELRLDLDPAIEAPRVLAPLIDPNVHSCGDVPPHGHRQLAHPDPGLYIVGMKSYGRAPTFLMATGYEQVRSVVAALAGDLAAADDVRLVLPTTGVCEGIGRPAADLAVAGIETMCCRPESLPPMSAEAVVDAQVCGRARCAPVG